ncbi:hypothetical protein GJAV_G00238200 [Gymnothorax javanicus]|nr:hypothetical protein GJAV_G00238200 [Gymnothorax javanicus]
MEKPKATEGMLKIPSEVTCVRLVSFSFVPVLRKLPAETKVITAEKERQLMRKSNEGIGRQQEAEKGQTMSGDGVFKAEFVRVGGDADEGDPRLARDTTFRKEAHSQYKIKSSYKALAAIPTNTLLLEQQAIDDEVEKEGPHRGDVDSVTETRSEMCSPAQLRQQSEELYAAIDQVLQDPLPMPRSQSAPLSLPTQADAEEPKRLTPVPKSPGRETKYATFQVQSYGLAEKHLTKPGVIRPVTAIPRLTEEEVEEDFPNPFRQQYLEEIAKGQAQMNLNAPAGHIVQMAEDSGDQGRSTFGGEDTLTKDETTLLITEKQETSSPLVAEGTTNTGPSSFNAAQKKTQSHETHI